MAEVHSKLLCKHFSYNIVPPLAWLLVAACSPACLPYLPACQHAPVVVPLKISASFAIQLIYIFFLLSIFFVLLFMSLSSILSSLFSVFSIRLYYSGAYIYFPVVGVVGCCWLLFCFILYPLCTTIFILYTQSYLHAFIFENSKNIM